MIVTVDHDEKEIREYKVDQLRFKPRRRRKKAEVEDAELKKLEALEKKEGKSKLGKSVHSMDVAMALLRAHTMDCPVYNYSNATRYPQAT